METKIEESEENLENINRSNRPMKLVEEFGSLCSNEWLDAKMQLDDIMEDMDQLKYAFLANIFMVSRKLT